MFSCRFRKHEYVLCNLYTCLLWTRWYYSASHCRDCLKSVSTFDVFRSRSVYLNDLLTSYRPALGPTQPPLPWVQWAVSPGVKQLGRESNHSPPSSAEVKKRFTPEEEVFKVNA
jgi:hypothetical protein